MLALRTTLVLALLTLSGCMGSPEPYKPYHPARRGPWDGPGSPEGYSAYRRSNGTRDPRPDPVAREAMERELRLEDVVPVQIDRTDADLARGRKAVGATMAAIPRQPWNQHRRDLDRVLGPAEGSKYYPRDPVKPAGPPAPKPEGEGEGEAEAEAAEGGEE